MRKPILPAISTVARRGGAVLALLLLPVAFSSATPPDPGSSALQPLDGDVTTLGLDLDVTGQVVGTSEAAPEDGGWWTGVRWPDPGSPIVLPPLDGDLESLGRTVNASGQVAGDSGDDLHFAPTPKRAVVWERDGTITVLPLPPGAPYSSASGMNARGQVVGRVFGGGFQQAVRWETDGSVTLLSTPEAHTPPNHWFIASAINDRGESVGVYRPPGPHRKPILWDEDGIGRELETLPDKPGGHAYSINNRGEAAGIVHFGVNPSNEPLGAIWSSQGQLRTLNPLPGHTASSARAVSESGIAVGASRSADGQSVPVMWERGSADATALELPNGYTQGSAGSINSRGQITVLVWDSPDLSDLTTFLLE